MTANKITSKLANHPKTDQTKKLNMTLTPTNNKSKQTSTTISNNSMKNKLNKQTNKQTSTQQEKQQQANNNMQRSSNITTTSNKQQTNNKQKHKRTTTQKTHAERRCGQGAAQTAARTDQKRAMNALANRLSLPTMTLKPTITTPTTS